MLTTTSARLNIKAVVGELCLPYGVNHIAAVLFFKLFHDDNTRLFGNFYIFSGMYDVGLNAPILYNYVI